MVRDGLLAMTTEGVDAARQRSRLTDVTTGRRALVRLADLDDAHDTTVAALDALAGRPR
jgi:hypothetical protein